jgi:hypothetical protein
MDDPAQFVQVILAAPPLAGDAVPTYTLLAWRAR